MSGFGCLEGGPNCISLPDSLTFDKSGNLWVSDDPAGRVLEYTSPQSTAENASLAIGQPNTTIINGAGLFNVTQSDMSGNDGVAIDPSGNLWVSDGLDNRVLEFLASVQGSATTSSSATPTTSTSSSVTAPTSSVSSTAASISISSTSLQQFSTNSATSIAVASSSSSSSSSTSISLNYLAVVAVVVLVMATTFTVVSAKTIKYVRNVSQSLFFVRRVVAQEI